MADTVHVRGLREGVKALRDVDREIGPEIRKAFNDVANIVVDTARPLIPSGPTGRARASLKASSSQRAVTIAYGGNKAPYAPWLDYGGKVGKGKSIVRRFIPSGRYIYPTLRRKRDDVEQAFVDAMDRVTARLR